MYVEVFWVVDVLVWSRLDAIYYSWFKVEEDGSWDVSRVVGLVEKDILPVAAFSRKVFEVTVLVDAMLET